MPRKNIRLLNKDKYRVHSIRNARGKLWYRRRKYKLKDDERKANNKENNRNSGEDWSDFKNF